MRISQHRPKELSRRTRWKIVRHATFRGTTYGIIAAASDAGCRSLRLRAGRRARLMSVSAQIHGAASVKLGRRRPDTDDRNRYPDPRRSIDEESRVSADRKAAINDRHAVTHAYAREIYASLFFSLSSSHTRRVRAGKAWTARSLHMHASIDMNASLHTKRPRCYLIPFSFRPRKVSATLGAAFRAETRHEDP